MNKDRTPGALCSGRAAAVLAAILLAVGVMALPAHAADNVPARLKGIDITPKLGTKVPLNHPFVDERGRKVELSQYFNPGKPVILVLAYYRCPMLCKLVLRSLASGLKDINMSAGSEFQVVVISIDPTETPDLAKLAHQKFVAGYARPGAGHGIHCLTGRNPDIKAIANAVGFHYRYYPEKHQYIHAAGIFILTPEGEISQCITGVLYQPKTLKYSLIQASNGKQGSVLDKILLWCCTYDPHKGKYTVGIMNLMRLVGIAVFLAVAALVVPVWLRSRHNHKKTETQEG